MRTKIIKAIVYPLFFILCLIFFLIRGFPIRLIGDMLTRQAEQKWGVKISVSELSTLFPNGIEAMSVRVTKEGEEGSPPLTLLLDRISARISLWSLLGGHASLSFSSNLLSGKLDGQATLSTDVWQLEQLEAQTFSLDLEKINIWSKALGINLAGKVTATVELNSPSKNLKDMKGKINLALEGGKFGNGQVKGLTLPWINLGKTEINLTVQEGNAKIKSFKVISDDLDASMEGYLTLQEKLAQISAHCKVRFKISDDFLNRNSKFKDLITISGLNQAKGADGYFSYSVFGPLAQPQFRPLK